ncbi:MAG: hypothetical protein R2862_07550 [Thermoanaerobaculia bacterium]
MILGHLDGRRHQEPPRPLREEGAADRLDQRRAMRTELAVRELRRLESGGSEAVDRRCRLLAAPPA